MFKPQISQPDLIEMIEEKTGKRITSQTLRDWEKADLITAPKRRVIIKKGGKESLYPLISYFEAITLMQFPAPDLKFVPTRVQIAQARNMVYKKFFSENKDELCFHIGSKFEKNFVADFINSGEIPENAFYFAAIFLRYCKELEKTIDEFMQME